MPPDFPMKRSLEDQIAAARLAKAQRDARLAALEAKAKTVARKRDTRRKIVVGAAVLVEMERTPRFAAFVRDMLDKAVTRPQDRETITDLLPVAGAEVTAPAVNGNAPPAGTIGDVSGQVVGTFPVNVREKAAG